MAKLYIGDPCYCLPDDIYTGIWGDKCHFQDGQIKDDETGTVYGEVHGTAYGDGYYGNELGDCPVDSGTLAILDMSKFEPLESAEENGIIIDLEGELSDFGLEYEDGTFTFQWCDGDHICCTTINTSDSDEDDDWEEDEDKD